MMRPTVDSPADLELTEEETTHRIIWTPKSYNPSIYLIQLNGTLAAMGDWNGSRIEFDFGDVTAGVYEYKITVYDFTGNSATDSVLVVVNPVDAYNLYIVSLLIVGALVGIAIAGLIRKRQSI